MRSTRYYLRLSRAFLLKFRLLLFLSISFGVLFFFLFFNLFSKFELHKQQIIGITGRFHPDSLPSEILLNMSYGLTNINNQNIPEPGIASSWETTDNGKTWVFKIKDGLTWQDNTPITSRNLMYEFSDVKIETPDDKTIKFIIENNFAPFPSVVSKPTFKKGLVGVTEWKVDKLTLSGAYVQELVLKNKKQKNIYRFFPTTESTKTAFKLGTVDIIENLLDPTPFDKWRQVKLESYAQQKQVVTLFYNTKSPLLSEKELRQALAYAINKEVLGKRAYSPIQPNSWAYNPQIKSYDYDLEKAKKAISEIEKAMKTELKINLVSSPSLLSIAEKIVKDWENAGINASILVSSIVPTDYDAYLTIYDIPIDPDQYSLWHSTQTTSNISKFSNSRIDKLLEDGRSTVNFEERKKIYFDFQRFLLEDLPASFLFHPTYYRIVRR